MSGSTGNPLNLNKFDGTDDVVRALTDLFNQNMDLINKGDVHVKVWQPNTVYQKADIVMHPYQLKLIYSYNTHTSSNSTTEADWGTKDGSKWASLSFTPNVIGWQANNYFQGNDIFFDGNELKRATQTGASSTLDRTASSFVGSRIASWTPNTKYNVGDLVLLKSLNADNTDNGRILNGILICNKAHISTTSFPASSEGTWSLTNQDNSYTITMSIKLAYGIGTSVFRSGSQVAFTIVTSDHGNIPSTNQSWQSLPDKIPDMFKVSSSMRIELYGGPATNPSATFEIAGVGMRFGTNTVLNNGTWLHGQENYITDADPYWVAGVPVQ